MGGKDTHLLWQASTSPLPGVVLLFFWYGMYRKQGWFTNPQMKNNSELPSGQWHCWPFDVHAPGAAWRRGRFVEHSSIRKSGVKVGRGRKTRPGPQKMPASKGNLGWWNVVIWPSKGFFCWCPSRECRDHGLNKGLLTTVKALFHCGGTLTLHEIQEISKFAFSTATWQVVWL